MHAVAAIMNTAQSLSATDDVIAKAFADEAHSQLKLLIDKESKIFTGTGQDIHFDNAVQAGLSEVCAPCPDIAVWPLALYR